MVAVVLVEPVSTLGRSFAAGAEFELLWESAGVAALVDSAGGRGISCCPVERFRYVSESHHSEVSSCERDRIAANADSPSGLSSEHPRRGEWGPDWQIAEYGFQAGGRVIFSADCQSRSDESGKRWRQFVDLDRGEFRDWKGEWLPVDVTTTTERHEGESDRCSTTARPMIATTSSTRTSPPLTTETETLDDSASTAGGPAKKTPSAERGASSATAVGGCDEATSHKEGVAAAALDHHQQLDRSPHTDCEADTTTGDTGDAAMGGQKSGHRLLPEGSRRDPDGEASAADGSGIEVIGSPTPAAEPGQGVFTTEARGHGEDLGSQSSPASKGSDLPQSGTPSPGAECRTAESGLPKEGFRRDADALPGPPSEPSCLRGELPSVRVCQLSEYPEPSELMTADELRGWRTIRDEDGRICGHFGPGRAGEMATWRAWLGRLKAFREELVRC